MRLQIFLERFSSTINYLVSILWMHLEKVSPSITSSIFFSCSSEINQYKLDHSMIKLLISMQP
jgi:hypothetical protein